MGTERREYVVDREHECGTLAAVTVSFQNDTESWTCPGCGAEVVRPDDTD